MTSTHKQVSDYPFIVVTEHGDDTQTIEINDLTVKLPGANGRTLVENVSMTISQGDRVVFTGASGTGKTTVVKAILNQWDHGAGIIRLPQNVRMMAASQNAYFPNATLREVMNLQPADQCTFKDEELADALRAVGHDNLIQHIPGQQTAILLNDLIGDLREILQNDHDSESDKECSVDEVAAALRPIIVQRVQDQFDVVQYVPEAQKESFRQNLKSLLQDKGEVRVDLKEEQLDNLADDILTQVDTVLVQPLYDHMFDFINKMFKKSKYGKAKASYLSWNLKRKTAKRLKAYMANKDTDDKSRDIRINAAQADYIKAALSDRVEAELLAHRPKRFLSSAFNALSWPLSLALVFRKAGHMAKDTVESLSYFMDRQIMTGETMRLSGGERQRLTIAMVLLHNPDILILDEITSALDIESGKQLYRDMMEKIPEKTTVISIAHNDHIRQFHTHNAHLENKKISLKPL